MAAATFGEGSSAVKFLDEKIKKQGEDEEVIADERQVLMALFNMVAKEQEIK